LFITFFILILTCYYDSSLSPNIVILEPGANPNSDNEILHILKFTKKILHYLE